MIIKTKAGVTRVEVKVKNSIRAEVRARAGAKAKIRAKGVNKEKLNLEKGT